MARLNSYKGNSKGTCEYLRKAIDKGFNNFDELRSNPAFYNSKDSSCFISIISGN